MYKVLVIEDEEMIRKGIVYSIDWLSIECVVVGEAENGEQGIKKIKVLQPDIILLDINMPIINGLELLEATKNQYLFSTIILSGYDDFSYAKKAIDFGVDTYLLKPIEEDKLYTAIEKAKESIKLKRKYALIENRKVQIKEEKVLNIHLWDSLDSSSTIIQAIRYIEENYREKITMDDIVSETSMSATYLNTQFKEVTSYTFNEFLNRYRIQKAIELIRTTDDKISTIALDVGFTTYRYFVRVFKRYTGIVPSEFHRSDY